MAKFTKLNIGDAVASSGGRVWKKLSVESAEEVKDPIGTWLVKEAIPTDLADLNISSECGVKGKFKYANNNGLYNAALNFKGIGIVSGQLIISTVLTLPAGSSKTRNVFYNSSGQCFSTYGASTTYKGYDPNSDTGVGMRTFTVTECFLGEEENAYDYLRLVATKIA